MLLELRCHRLSWSPDGRALGVPNAAKAQQQVIPCLLSELVSFLRVQIAAIICREAWRSQADLVGHRHAVTVVRFSPRLS